MTTEIENNVPIPTQKKPRKPRTGRAEKDKPKEASGAERLISALKFISLAQKPEGTPYQVHSYISNHWALAFDGVLSIGCPIVEDLSACPNTFRLLAALSKCGQEYSIAQTNLLTLAVKSQRFKATIECIAADSLATSYPDIPLGPIDDRIKEGLKQLSWIPTEGAERAFAACILLQDQTMVATDSHCILEYFHSISLPNDIMIPKASVMAMLKIDKKLAKFGFSSDSFTFWYEDGSYLKTQLFKDKFPAYQQIFNKMDTGITQVPAEFFEGIRTVAPFIKDKIVMFRPGKICTSNDPDIGASYEIAGLPDSNWNYELLLNMEPHFENVSFRSDAMQVFFNKGTLRGSIMGIK